MTAPVITDKAVHTLAMRLGCSTSQAREHLTVALAPEPTPLQLVASVIEKELAKQEANDPDAYDFMSVAQRAIDAYAAASGKKYTYEEIDAAIKNASVLADVRNYIKGLGK